MNSVDFSQLIKQQFIATLCEEPFLMPSRKVISPERLQEIMGHQGHLFKKWCLCYTLINSLGFGVGKTKNETSSAISQLSELYFLICKMASSIPTFLPGLQVTHTNCSITVSDFFPRGCESSIVPKTVSATVPICLLEPFGKPEHKVSPFPLRCRAGRLLQFRQRGNS